MKYLLFAFPLFIYFELLGRYLFLKLNKQPLDFSFVVGFLFMIATLYVTGWPISAFCGPSIAYVALVLLFFLITIFLIIKNIKKLNFKFDIKLWFVFGLLLLFEIYMSWNRTLGDPHGFDAVYYINYISSNVDTPSLNNVNPLFGTSPNTFETRITYYFQSYNYFISSFVYIVKYLFSLINKTIDFLPLYVWTFQILLHMFFIGISLMSIKELKIKNKALQLSLVVLLVLFMNNLYYNNAYGFIGNSFRMSIHAVATIFLFRYFNTNDRKDFFLFLLSMIGLCGFSSTGTFATIFILFALFFILYKKERNLIKYYVIVLFVPVLNILCVKLGVKLWVVFATLIVFVVVYFLNDFILKIYNNKYLRYGTIVIIPLITIVLSLTMNQNLFYGFLNNYSEFQDMSWDYFSFHDYRHWIFNLIVLVPLFFHLIKNYKHPFSIVCTILIFTVFNPFGANFMNKINWVYYRTYDLIINQFTLAYFIFYLNDNFNRQHLLSGLVLALSGIMAITQIPRYWHYSFKPDEDYNYIYKIENSELEMIRNVQQLVSDYNLDNPRIINCTFYMNSFIEDGTYLIGKERRFNYDDEKEASELNYNLYCIFFPSDGFDNFRPNDEPIYNSVIEYLNESDYDILIIENGLWLEYKGEYTSLDLAVTSDGTYEKSPYSTAKYAVIYLNKR